MDGAIIAHDRRSKPLERLSMNPRPTPRTDAPTETLVSAALLSAAVRDSLRKLAPAAQWRNPLTFGLYVGIIFMAVVGVICIFGASDGTPRALFSIEVAAWLGLSVLSTGVAEATAEQWGRARAARLRSIGGNIQAKLLAGADRREYRVVDAGMLRRGDVVLIEADDVIPADGTVIDGAASVSEAAVTGESAPVLRAADRELSSVRRGTHVLSDWLVVRVRSREGFFDPISTISTGAARSLAAHDHVPWLLLGAITIGFLICAAWLAPAAALSRGGLGLSVLVAIFVCSIPIAARLAVFAIGIAGTTRLLRDNVIASDGGAVEAAADIDVLVLDKTGTITRGDRHAVAFETAPGVCARDLMETAQLASLADETPEGRSIVALARQMPELARRDLTHTPCTFHEFSAQTRISGIDLEGRKLRKGAVDAVRRFVEQSGGSWPPAVDELIERVARSGATPLVVAEGARVQGVIELRDIVKGGIREHCEALRRMGVKTLMVTGDHRLTAATIAAEVGVDDFLAEATPEVKREFIRRRQQQGHRVAMCGDGTNDAPALAQADLSVAMNSGTPLAKQAGNLVALDSDPTKFVAIIETGRQMRLTRRSLMTFGFAADLANYVAVLSVACAAAIPSLAAANFLRLTSPRDAVLSAVIFNAWIIAAIFLLAIRGVKEPPQALTRLRRQAAWLYGLAGLLSAWVGIKLIDVLLSN
jgi:potassium-transporting ATPase ATP-binding subunit